MTRTRLHGRSAAAALSFTLVACSGGGSTPPPDQPPPVGGFAVTVRGGVTDYGSGVHGLAVLATVRDDAGAGPATPWDAQLAGTGGVIDSGIPYDAPGPGSFVAWTWPGHLVTAAEPLELRIGPTPVDHTPAPFTASPPSSGLAVPRPRLALDGHAVVWPAIAAAASYRCAILGDAGSVEAYATTPACDVSALAPGAYVVQVQAFSVNLVALGASTARLPDLPARFDVAEGRLGILVPDAGGTALQLVAAGGAVRFNGEDYVAAWTSITAPDGTPTANGWTVSLKLVGGSVTDSTTLAPYPPVTVRALETDTYALRAVRGDYLLVATAAGKVLKTFVHLGAPARLAAPIGVTVTPDASGGAGVAWSAVAGAASYLVRAYDADGIEVAGGWTAGASFDFPPDTFLPAADYDVYVLATDADMVGGAAPTQVGAAETTYPARFTAP